MADKPKFELRKIEPWEAQALLASVPDYQRAVSERFVAKYAADMRSGAWGISNDAIVLSESGDLINGQHRMTAVSRVDVPVEFLVMVVADSDARTMFAELDQGKPRSVGDFLRSRGETDTTARAALISALWRFDQTSEPAALVKSNMRPTAHQVAEWIDSNPPIDASMTVHHRLRRMGCGSAFAALHYLWDRDCDPDMAAEFWENAWTGDCEFRSGPWLLRDRILRNAGSRDKTPTRVRVAEAIVAWNMFLTGRSGKLLYWRSNTSFPDWRDVWAERSGDRP